jgi:hypothetical protein
MGLGGARYGQLEFSKPPAACSRAAGRAPARRYCILLLAHTRCSASRRPGALGRAGAQASSASHVSCRSGYVYLCKSTYMCLASQGLLVALQGRACCYQPPAPAIYLLTAMSTTVRRRMIVVRAQNQSAHDAKKNINY